MPYADTLPYELMSTAVPQSEDNRYEFHEIGFLIPHEAIRREMRRAKNAFANFDPVAHPWKALNVKTWFHELFLPMIHEHHDLEEQIMGPELIKRGGTIPDSMKGEHVTLLAALEKVEALVSEIWDLIDVTKATPDIITAKVEELKALYSALYDDMFRHLEAEEGYFPAEIKKIGKKSFEEIEALILKKVQGNKVGEMFIMSVLDSFGFDFKGFSHVDGDTRWLHPEQVDKEVLAKIPGFVRALIFPGFNKRYQRFKVMINSVAGDVDILQLQHVSAGCACVIS